MRGLFVVLACVAAWCAPVHAQSRALSWAAPTGCASEVEVASEITRLLGGELPPDAPRVDARVDGSGDTWRLRLRVGEQSERVLRARSCALLVEATTLIVALAIDPVRVVEATDTAPTVAAPTVALTPAPDLATEPDTSEPVEAWSSLAPPRTGVPGEALVRPEPSPAEERVRAVEPPVVASRASASPLPPSPPPPPTREEPPRRALPIERVGVLLSVALELGSSPEPTAAFGVDVRGRLGRFLFEGGLHVALPREARAPADATARARLALGTARLALGWPLPLGPLRWVPRVVGELGVAGGRGSGISDPTLGLTTWLALGAGVALELPIRRRGVLGLVADGLVPLLRPGFVLDPAGEVHRASPVVGRVGLRGGLRWR